MQWADYASFLLVGGPAHGRWVLVRKDTLGIRIPTITDVITLPAGPAASWAPVRSDTVYLPHKFFCAPESPYTVFAPEGWDDKQVFEELLRGYTGGTSDGKSVVRYADPEPTIRGLQRDIDRLEAEVRHLREIERSRAKAVETHNVFDLVSHLYRQMAFSLHTFGPGPRTKGVCDHLRKELKEIEAAPNDVTEWSDVILLGLDGAWRSGHTPQEIVAALDAKQTKNEGRTWPDWRTASPDKAIEHVRPESSEKIPQDAALVGAVNPRDKLVRTARTLLNSTIKVQAADAGPGRRAIGVEWPEWDALADAVAEAEGEGNG